MHPLVFLSVLASGLAIPDIVAARSIPRGQVCRKLDVPQTGIRQATYLDDGQTFVVCSQAELTLVDTGTLRWRKLPAEVFLALSQDGQRLVTGTPNVEYRDRVAVGPVLPDGGRLVTGRPVRDGVAGPLTVWDVASQRPVGQLQWKPEWNWPNKHFLHPGGCVFLPDNRTLACGYTATTPVDAEGPGELRKTSYLHSVGLWNVDNGNLAATWGVEPPMFGTRKLSLAVSPDGKFLATCAYGGIPSVILLETRAKDKLFVYETSSGKITHRLIDDARIPLFAGSETRGIAYSPDGTLIAAVVVNGYGWSEVIVWDVATGKPSPPRKQSLSGEKQRYVVPADPGEKERYVLPPKGFSPDGKHLVLIGGLCPVIVEVESRSPVSELNVRQGHAQPIKAAAFSRDGKVLATAAEDGIRFWNLAHDKFGMKPRGN